MGKISIRQTTCKTGEIVTIRNANSADALRLNALAMDVFATSEYLITTAQDFVPNDQKQEDRIKWYEEGEGRILIVAESGDELIGMLDFQNGQRKRIEHKGTFGMSVRSTWRDKGIGTLLLGELLDWVKRHSFLEVICLGVLESNMPARALYSKMGFDITGREPFGVKLGPGQFLADLSMSLRVSK